MMRETQKAGKRGHMADAAGAIQRSMLEVAGAKIEVHEIGAGPPVLFLHGGQGPVPAHPFFATLAKASSRRLVMPTHPGFGGSSLPDWLDSCDDVAHIHLELMDKLGIARVPVIGGSIGGWIAVEMATKAPERFSHLVLIGAVGVKTGSADRLDIPDIFALPVERMQALLFHDPAKHGTDPVQTDDELIGIVRARETMALLAWEPYMHNPKLVHRLHRINAPTLMLRGASDGLVSAEYATAYARLIPGARLETIAAAGHVPHIEQPDATVELIHRFLAT